MSVNHQWREVDIVNMPRGIEWRVPRNYRDPVIDRSFVVDDGSIYLRTFDRAHNVLHYHRRALTEQELSLSGDELLDGQSAV